MHGDWCDWRGLIMQLFRVPVASGGDSDGFGPIAIEFCDSVAYETRG